MEHDVKTLGVNRAWWHEAGILYVSYGDERHCDGEAFTKEQALDGCELVASFVGSATVYMIADIRKIRRATREARRLEIEDPQSCVALLVGCTVTRMLATAYAGLGRPKHETRVFSSEDQAVDWLRSMRACREQECVTGPLEHEQGVSEDAVLPL